MSIPEDPIRKLARSYYWQVIYNRGKESSSVRLFENETDLTKIQIIFLQYLEQISNLYMDLALDKPLISDEVIDCPIRSEAYLLYKSKKKREEIETNPDIQQSHDKIVFINKKKT